VVLGDCIEVMAEWPENSVDCIVTDPPYGISFMGKEWDRALPLRAAFEQMVRVLKPGALAFVMSSPRQDVLWRMLSLLEGVGFELRQSFISWIYKSGFPKAYDVSKGIDSKYVKLKVEYREPFGRGGRQQKPNGSPFETDYEGKNGKIPYSIPQTDEAKKWSGWKSQTGLKPAAECILMVNKPRSETTIVDNVLRWGTGAMNVDVCRIPFKQDDNIHAKNPHTVRKTENYEFRSRNFNEGAIPEESKYDIPKGRFPANLLISDGALDTGETTKSTGGTRETIQSIGGGRGAYRGGDNRGFFNYGDEGSPYRFFDLDAWAEHHGFLDVAKPSREERSFGLWDMPKGTPPGSKRSKPAEGRENPLGRMRANYHPTVKPVKLMAYLIELGCPTKGIVVDPFLGSGTTCIAAKKLRRQWIGIEINPEYADIAEARINIKGPLDQFMEAET